MSHVIFLHKIATAVAAATALVLLTWVIVVALRPRRPPPTPIEMGMYALECSHLPRDERWCQENDDLVQGYFRDGVNSADLAVREQATMGLYVARMRDAEQLTRAMHAIAADASPDTGNGQGEER